MTSSRMRGSRVVDCLSVLAFIGPITVGWAVEAPTAMVLQNPPGSQDQVTGTVEAGSTVRVYGDVTLGSVIASDVATDGTFNFWIGDNTYAIVYMTATDAGENVSTATAVPNDIVPPAVPVVSVSQNAPGAEDRVTGTAEPGSIVRVFTNSSRSSMIASGVVTSGQFDFPIGDNGHPAVHVIAIDTAGNEGLGADASNDIVAPSAPPVSVQQNSPGTQDRVQGWTDVDVKIRVWNDSSRSTAIATGLTTNGSIDLPIGDNLHPLVFVTATDVAGNESAGATATNDIIAPAAPSAFVEQHPPGAPDIIYGTAEAGASVRAYTDSTRNSLIASGIAFGWGYRFSIGNNLYPSVFAAARDAAGNESTGVTATNDIEAPAPPTALVTQNVACIPDRVSGEAEPGSWVIVSPDSTRSSYVNTALTTNGLYDLAIGDNQVSTVFVRAMDASGNQSQDVVTLNEFPPAPMVQVTQNSPGTPDRVSGTAQVGSRVRVYSFYANSCSGSMITSSIASDGTYDLAIGDNVYHSVYVTATNSAGDQGPMTSGLNDIVAPTSPTVTVAQNPPGTQDRILGSAEVNSTVRIYTSSSRSALIVSAVAVNGIYDLPIGDNTNASVYVTATDSVGNESSGTEGLNDILPPEAPTIFVELSGAGQLDRLIGSAEPGSLVRVYTDSTKTTRIVTAVALGDLFDFPGAPSTYPSIFVTTIDAAGNESPGAFSSGCAVTPLTPTPRGTTTHVYDALDRPIRRTDPLGRVTQFEYDAVGNLVRETDPAGHVTTHQYDALRRLTSTTDPLGQVTSFTYDPDGNLLTVTDALGKVWSFTYDRNNRLTSETDPLGNRTTSTYDPDGNLATRTDALGRTTQYTYDAHERLQSITYPNGESVLTAYTAEGDPAGITASGYSLQQRWGENGVPRRLTSQSYSVEGRSTRVDYGYDGERRIRSISVAPSSGVAASTFYAYNSRGQLGTMSTKVGSQPQRGMFYRYSPAGQRRAVYRPNGVVTYQDFDAAGQLLEVRHSSCGQAITTFSYGYDTEGLRIARTGPGGLQTYTYDAAHRVVRSAGPTESETFFYDAVGNVETIQNGSGHRQLVYDAANRLLAETGDTSATYQHDSNGNVVQRTVEGGDVASCEWDARNKLTQVSVNGAVVTSYAYHPLTDLMLKKSVPGSPARYSLWARQNPLVDLSPGAAAGTLAPTAHYAASESYDELESIFSTAVSTTFYPLRDALQSVYHLVDGAGIRAASYDYSAYGEPRGWTDESGTANRFTFTGREYDESTGLYYYRARWYSAAQARFASVDPIQEKQRRSLASFTYADGDPIMRTDALGLIPDCKDACKCRPGSEYLKGMKPHERGRRLLSRKTLYGYHPGCPTLTAEFAEETYLIEADIDLEYWRSYIPSGKCPPNACPDRFSRLDTQSMEGPKTFPRIFVMCSPWIITFAGH